MPFIILIAVVGILVLQISGAIPQDAVGGGLVVAAFFFAAALAVAVHEAWTKKRGVLGWIVNVLVAFVGAFIAAQLGGPIVAIPLLMLVGGTSSLAAAGGTVMSVALVLVLVITLLGSWGALWLVNRSKSRQ